MPILHPWSTLHALGRVPARHTYDTWVLLAPTSHDPGIRELFVQPTDMERSRRRNGMAKYFRHSNRNRRSPEEWRPWSLPHWSRSDRRNQRICGPCSAPDHQASFPPAWLSGNGMSQVFDRKTSQDPVRIADVEYRYWTMELFCDGGSGMARTERKMK